MEDHTAILVLIPKCLLSQR